LHLHRPAYRQAAARHVVGQAVDAEGGVGLGGLLSYGIGRRCTAAILRNIGKPSIPLPQRRTQESERTRNTLCAVSPKIPFFSASLKYAPSRAFLGSGSPIGKGWSEPSMTRPGPAFLARYSSVSASNTQESKYIASKPLRGSAY